MAGENQAELPQPPASGYMRLFLDDDPARAEAFFDKFPDAHWVQTAIDCIKELTDKVWDEIHLDHDLEGEWFVDSERADCGMEVVRWLTVEPRTHLMASKFIVHSHNPNAAMTMVTQLGLAGYYVIDQPFSTAPAQPEQTGMDLFQPGGASRVNSPVNEKPLSDSVSVKPSLLMRILRWFVPPPTVNQSWENAPAREMKIPRRGIKTTDEADDGWGTSGGEMIDAEGSEDEPAGPFVMPIREDDLESFGQNRGGKAKRRSEND